MRQVTHALLTRPPLSHKWFIRRIIISASLDLHVLSTPPAFILSQDQTLMLKSWSKSGLLSLANYPKPSLLGFCSEFSQIQRSKPDLLFSEFSGFYILFNLQLSRISFRCQTYLLQRLFIITGCFSFVNNFLNLFFCFFRNICRSLKREDYISKSQTVCQQLFSFFISFSQKIRRSVLDLWTTISF